jgi:hypothetical protein
MSYGKTMTDKTFRQKPKIFMCHGQWIRGYCGIRLQKHVC